MSKWKYSACAFIVPVMLVTMNIISGLSKFGQIWVMASLILALCPRPSFKFEFSYLKILNFNLWFTSTMFVLELWKKTRDHSLLQIRTRINSYGFQYIFAGQHFLHSTKSKYHSCLQSTNLAPFILNSNITSHGSCKPKSRLLNLLFMYPFCWVLSNRIAGSLGVKRGRR